MTGEVAKVILDGYNAAGGLLLGRATYEIFAAAWPSRTGELADRINGLPKYATASRLDTVAWANARVITGDVAAGVAALKRQPGGIS